MKVLMLSKAVVVGAYQRKLEEIAARGVELTVVVPPRWRDLCLERQFTRGYRLVVAPLRFAGHFHLHYYPTLAQHMHAAQPDIVHVDEEPWDLVTYHAVRQARAVGARALFFSWQNLLRRYPPPFNWFQRYNFHHCAHTIAGNNDAQAVLRAKGYRGAVSVIAQFGVDAEIFSPPPQPSPLSREMEHSFTIAYAGRLTHEKGVDVLLRAVAGLDGDWRLRLVGDGAARMALRRLATELQLGERVRFEPHLPSVAMPDFYRQIDVFVLPSRSTRHWVEQFGRVLIEAMACGVPVVGAASGEIPHTVGDAGLIFPEGDAVALRKCIARLMADAALRLQLAERGRARVLAKFTQASVAQRTVEVYEAMMRG